MAQQVEHRPPTSATCLLSSRRCVPSLSPACPNAVALTWGQIWIPLRDPNQNIREAAAAALHATLVLISERELAVQEKWYGAITAEANKGFQSANADHIHASLLALGELLQVSGPFMHKRFKESCDRILKYREHRDKLLRRTVIRLLPKLAASHPESFVLNYRHTCINHLLSTLKKDSDRGPCFIALGELAIVRSFL